jgi:hypothetical protein
MTAARRTCQLVKFGASAALVAVSLLMGETIAGATSGVAISSPQYGFSFRLPSDWKEVPLNGSDVTALLNSASHADPSLANALNSEVTSGASKGMKVFAIGPLAGSSVPNVNVIVTSDAGGPTGRGFAQEAVPQTKILLTELAASDIKVSVVKNGLGYTARASYQLHLKNSATQFGEQFYVEHANNIDIVTVTTSSSTSTRSVAGRIAASWRW